MTSHGVRSVAVMTAIHTHYLTSNGTLNSTMLPESDMALVTYSPVIAGTMLFLMTGIMMYVIILMRQKQKRIQEATSLSNLPWVESLEVFTLSGTDAAAGIYLPPTSPATPGPPPTYDSVVPIPDKAKEEQQTNILQVEEERKKKEPKPSDSDDLPSYEAAIKMEGNI